MKKFILSISAILICSTIKAQTIADDIAGIWLTNGKDPAKIQIFKTGERYFGKIVWLKFPLADGKPKIDKNNPDINKRTQQIIGLTILNEFKFDGTDEWEDGKIYDPESGKTYNCTISFKDKNTLKARGYIGISLFGRTEEWVRSSM